MKKILVCLVAATAIILSGCEKKNVETVKTVRCQFALNPAVADYYDVMAEYTLPGQTMQRVKLDFRPVSDSLLADVYKEYKNVQDTYGVVSGVDWKVQTTTAGQGWFHLIFTAKEGATIDKSATYSPVILLKSWSEDNGSLQGSIISEKKTAKNISGSQYEGWLKASLGVVMNDTLYLSFTNPQ